MSRRFKFSSKVAGHLVTIEQAIIDKDLVGMVCPSTVLALVHVESSGNPCSHRDGSQFYGLLQIGHDVSEDVRGDKDSAYYHCSAQRSVEAFLDWCNKYEEIHQWEPDWIAIGWKGGVGTLETYLHRKIKKGQSEEKLTAFLKGRWRTDKYLRWFDDAQVVWVPWYDEMWFQGKTLID